MVYDLTRMGERTFEDMCRALAVHVLGSGVQAFGDGPDGGREASFEGLLRHPEPAVDGPWNGFGVLQAKYRRSGVGQKDLDWLRREITKELAAWSDPDRKRVAEGRVPEYLIIATNIRLTSAIRVGGIDRMRTFMARHAERIGLKGWALWDANQLTMYLNAHPAVSTKFTDSITSGDVLAKVYAKLDDVGTAPARGYIRVGQGQAGNERPFQTAYHLAGGQTVLGTPTSEVYDDGPGWVQHFAGGPGRGPAAICARQEHAAIAVDADVWDAICAAGAGLGRLDAVGYPAATTRASPFIGADADDVLLEGGRWGPGRMTRQPDGSWYWAAQVGFSFNSRERDRWTSGSEKMDLRLRCAARIEWQTENLAVDRSRRQLVANLSSGPLRQVVLQVAQHLGLEGEAARWERTPDEEGYNDRRFASYRLRVAGEGDRTALGVWAWLQLPDGLQATVISMVDMRVDFTALPNGPDQHRDTAVDPTRRLSMDQLVDVFTTGWATATKVLPTAITNDPLLLKATGPTTIELHLNSERPPASGGERTLGLLDMVDLTPLGEPPSQLRPQMSAAVTAPLRLDHDGIKKLVIETLAYMGSGFGFLEPDGPTAD
jgi:hypothetical protein